MGLDSVGPLEQWRDTGLIVDYVYKYIGLKKKVRSIYRVLPMK
jgi:hypothetical protein